MHARGGQVRGYTHHRDSRRDGSVCQDTGQSGGHTTSLRARRSHVSGEYTPAINIWSVKGHMLGGLYYLI